MSQITEIRKYKFKTGMLKKKVRIFYFVIPCEFLYPQSRTSRIPSTGWVRLIRSHSSARFSFELSGNSNYIIHCNSNYVQNFELEINSIENFELGLTSNYYFELWLPSN